MQIAFEVLEMFVSSDTYDILVLRMLFFSPRLNILFLGRLSVEMHIWSKNSGKKAWCNTVIFLKSVIRIENLASTVQFCCRLAVCCIENKKVYLKTSDHCIAILARTIIFTF